jgi:hypothetical protein
MERNGPVISAKPTKNTLNGKVQNNMDEIIKQTIIQIAVTAYNAGRSGMTNEAFLMLLSGTLKQTEEYAQAEPSLEELDPNAYAS